MTDRVAEKFLSLGLQHWGQSAKDRAAAFQDYLRAAGFSVEVAPLKDAEFAKAIGGVDAEAATRWLIQVLRTMPRGKYETEAEHLRAALNRTEGASA